MLPVGGQLPETPCRRFNEAAGADPADALRTPPTTIVVQQGMLQ